MLDDTIDNKGLLGHPWLNDVKYWSSFCLFYRYFTIHTPFFGLKQFWKNLSIEFQLTAYGNTIKFQLRNAMLNLIVSRFRRVSIEIFQLALRKPNLSIETLFCQSKFNWAYGNTALADRQKLKLKHWWIKSPNHDPIQAENDTISYKLKRRVNIKRRGYKRTRSLLWQTTVKGVNWEELSVWLESVHLLFTNEA